MNLSYALYQVLHGDSNVESMVGTNIYPDVIKRYSTLPAITYTLNNVNITETKDSTTKWDSVDITITLLAKTRSDAEELAGYVRIAMDRKYGVKGTDTWITSQHKGESWEFIDDQSLMEDSASVGLGKFATIMNFQVVVSDVSDYAPGSGSVSTRYVRYHDGTLTLTAGNNTFTHNLGTKLRTLRISDSTNTSNWIPNWINTSENAATIEWLGSDLTNARIKTTY